MGRDFPLSGSKVNDEPTGFRCKSCRAGVIGPLGLEPDGSCPWCGDQAV